MERRSSPITLFDDEVPMAMPMQVEREDPTAATATATPSPKAFPRIIPSDMRDRLHSAPSCIDARTDGHLAIKCRVTERGGAWRNRVEGSRASIAVNRQTATDNARVRSGAPCHLLTFTTGADTFYWGRYRCVGGGADRFEMERIEDDPEAQALLAQLGAGFPSSPAYRSRLERAYAERFKKGGVAARYEPVTLHLSETRQYTPDFMISAPPHAPLLIEIKGAVVDEEIALCSRVALMGFHIALLFGDAAEMSDATCFEFLPYQAEPARSLPALLRGI